MYTLRRVEQVFQPALFVLQVTVLGKGPEGKLYGRQWMNTVLFDLDGTLLPMEQEAFNHQYFTRLGKKFQPLGFEPKAFIEAMWQGIYAMFRNDGKITNEQRFWPALSAALGRDARVLEPIFEDFYANEFLEIKDVVTHPNPLSAACVKTLKDKGYELVLASNPIFSFSGASARMGWAGVDPKDFARITLYDNSSYCKPDVRYFSEILEKMGKTPGECLMVGNNVREDMCAARLGIHTFLVTDYLMNPDQENLAVYPKGSLQDLFEYLDALPKSM